MQKGIWSKSHPKGSKQLIITHYNLLFRPNSLKMDFVQGFVVDSSIEKDFLILLILIPILITVGDFGNSLEDLQT